MNPDKLSMLPVRSASTASMSVLGAIQDMPPEEATVGVTSAFFLIAERWGLDPRDLLGLTTNIMNHADGRRPEFAAVAEFLRNEWNP